MALIALVSAKGSPGVTTTTLMLSAVWPRPVLVAECDPAGGDIAAGFYRGAAEVPGGVLAVASRLRRGVQPEEFFEHAMPLDEAQQRWVLPGFRDPAQAGALASQWGAFAEACEALAQQGMDVIADCGRLQAAYAPTELIRRAAAVGLVARPTLVALRATYPWVATLRAELADDTVSHSSRLQLIVVGEKGTVTATELVRLLDVPLAGVVSWDPRVAGYFSEGRDAPRGIWRSATLRDVRLAGERLDKGTAVVRGRPRGTEPPASRTAREAFLEARRVRP